MISLDPPPPPETPGCWIYLPNECPANFRIHEFPSETDFLKWVSLKTPENRKESCENKTKEIEKKCEDAGALFEFVGKVLQLIFDFKL